MLPHLALQHDRTLPSPPPNRTPFGGRRLSPEFAGRNIHATSVKLRRNTPPLHLPQHEMILLAEVIRHEDCRLPQPSGSERPRRSRGRGLLLPHLGAPAGPGVEPGVGPAPPCRRLPPRGGCRDEKEDVADWIGYPWPQRGAGGGRPRDILGRRAGAGGPQRRGHRLGLYRRRTGHAHDPGARVLLWRAGAAEEPRLHRGAVLHHLRRGLRGVDLLGLQPRLRPQPQRLHRRPEVPPAPTASGWSRTKRTRPISPRCRSTSSR